MDTTEDSGHDR